jgi:HEAT repeat protein
MGASARPALPDLAEHLQDSDAAVRGKVARALGRIGGLSPSLVQSLSALTSDEDERVRFEAKRALGRAAQP